MARRSDGKAAARVVPAPAAELALAFANTRYWRGRAAPVETLHAPADLLAWCAGQRVVDAVGAARMAAWVRREEGARLFADALAAREAIHALMSGAIAGSVPAKELRLLNALLAAAPARDRLVQGKQGVGWAVPAVAPSAAVLLAPVLWAAADLLAGDGLARLRRCGNDECRWLFVDESKSGTRRWCAMASCGNRAKAQRHYLRKTGRAAEIAG